MGKSTLLRILAGLEQPDEGAVERTPATLTVGYLPQEHDRRPGETLLAYLARRTGVADGGGGARAAQRPRWSPRARYAAALERFLALGGGDLEARARARSAPSSACRVSLDQATATLSGGEAARAALAAILLSRFDLLLLDEPTNDLDFDGLERLERFVDAFAGGLARRLARPRLPRPDGDADRRDRPVDAQLREWAGGWSDYARRASRPREAVRRVRATPRSGGGRSRRSCTPGATRRVPAGGFLAQDRGPTGAAPTR